MSSLFWSRPLPNWVYEAVPCLIGNYKDLRNTAITLSQCQNTVLQQGDDKSEQYSAGSDDESECENLAQNLKDVAEFLSKILQDMFVDGPKLEQFDDLQKKLVSSYLRFVLNQDAINKIFTKELRGSKWSLMRSEFTDLSKRKDETLKKVLSVALKVIYKEYLFENKINQSLNPRKYVKREEVNKRIFSFYFNRESQATLRKNDTNSFEHCLLFFIKEGVTEEWFEAIIGIRHGNPALKTPVLTFLIKILETLHSEQLINIYKKKITSMIQKTFLVDKKPRSHENVVREDSSLKIIEKLDNSSKKPKTALSICQFRQAIQIANSTLKRFTHKYSLSLPQPVYEKFFSKIE